MSNIYFIKSENQVKIGYAKNMYMRVANLRTALPNLEVLFVIESEQAKLLEAELHDMFVDKRINGEWYSLTDDDLEMVKQIYETKPYENNTTYRAARALKDTKVQAFNLELDTLEVLQEYAIQNKISLSDVARRAFKEFITNNELE